MRKLLVSLLVAVFLLLVSPGAVDDSGSLKRRVAQRSSVASTQPFAPFALTVADVSRDTMLFSVHELLRPAYPVIEAAPDDPVPAEPPQEPRKPEQFAMVSESGLELVSRSVPRRPLRHEAEPNHVAVTTRTHGLLA